MNKEDVKHKIMRQVKDPDSALHYLLNLQQKIRALNWSSGNIDACNVSLNVSQFDMIVDFTFTPEFFNDDDANVSVPMGAGACHVLFSDTKDAYDDGLTTHLNISNKAALSKLNFIEECIEESTTKPNTLSFGLRSFNLSHDDYEFYRVYKHPAFHTVDLDVANMTFASNYEKTVSLWGEYRRNSNNVHMPHYLEYFVPMIKEVSLLPESLKNKIVRLVPDRSTISWFNPLADSRLSEITEFIKFIAINQRLDLLLSAS